MSITEKTHLSPSKIWQAWVHAHALHGEGALRPGATGYMGGKGKKIRYQIVDVIPGKSFSILWKGLFVQFVFHHVVIPSRNGSEVQYQCEIKGIFGWMVRWFLIDRIRSNLRHVLKSFIQRLETERSSYAHNR